MVSEHARRDVEPIEERARHPAERDEETLLSGRAPAKNIGLTVGDMARVTREIDIDGCHKGWRHLGPEAKAPVRGSGPVLPGCRPCRPVHEHQHGVESATRPAHDVSDHDLGNAPRAEEALASGFDLHRSHRRAAALKGERVPPCACPNVEDVTANLRR